MHDFKETAAVGAQIAEWMFGMGKLGKFVNVTERAGVQVALSQLLTSVAFSLTSGKGRFALSCSKMQSNAIGRYVSRTYGDVIRDWNQQPETAVPFHKQELIPAWSYWTQGEGDAPDLCKRLFNIHRKQLKECDYHVISADTVDQFVELPGMIFDKRRRGIISEAHFTDILRCALLKQYGGLWVDSTILLTDTVPRTIWDVPFYFAKGCSDNNVYAALSPETSQWESSFLAAQRQSLFFSFLLDMLIRYWSDEDENILYYFLIHQFALVGLHGISVLAQEEKLIPDNNWSYPLLSERLLMKNEYDQSVQIDEKTYCFKLSRTAAYDPRKLEAVLSAVEHGEPIRRKY